MMKRPDPMICATYGASDTVANSNRQAWMEELFFLDGRDMISHPKHGLFTGLAEKYQNLDSTDGI